MTMGGVYMIINLRNRKRYVGCSLHMARRRTAHFSNLKAERHSNRHLQSAYRKYGAEAFDFVVLEHVEDPAMLRSAEQRWIDSFCACERAQGYNIVPDSQHKRLSPETRALLSATRIGKPLSKQHCTNIGFGLIGKPKSQGHRNRLRLANLGKKHSLSTRAKIAAAWRPVSDQARARISSALKGHPVSDATRSSIGESKRGRALPARRVTTKDQRIEINARLAAGESISALARAFAISRATIHNIRENRYLPLDVAAIAELTAPAPGSGSPPGRQEALL